MRPHEINSFRGGVSDENDKGVVGSFKHGEALDIHAQDDALTARQALTTVFGASNTTQAGVFNFFVNAIDGSTYAFGSTGSIYARSGGGVWNNVYNDENGAILGAAEWQLSDGVNYMFWATATSVARKTMPGTTTAPDSAQGLWADATQDWRATLDAADWHTMRPASGSLLIANNEYIAEIGYGGVFNNTALDIRPGNVIKTLEERDDYAIMGTGRKDKSEEGHIFSWISSATSWVQKKRIPIKGINTLINTEFLIAQGGSDGELFFTDFVNATPLHGIPGGGQANPGGAAIEDDIAMFGIYGGTYPGIWSYGRKRKNRPYALNYPYLMVPALAGSTISTISAVTVADGTLLASWGTTDGSTSDYGVDAVDSSSKATAKYEGLEFSVSPHLKKKFNTVKLILDPMVSGTSVSVRFKKDHKTTEGDSSAGAGWKYAVTGGGATSFGVEDATEAIFTLGDVAQTYELGIDLNPTSNSSPKVYSAVTYVDNDSYDY